MAPSPARPGLLPHSYGGLGKPGSSWWSCLLHLCPSQAHGVCSCRPLTVGSGCVERASVFSSLCLVPLTERACIDPRRVLGSCVCNRAQALASLGLTCSRPLSWEGAQGGARHGPCCLCPGAAPRQLPQH